MLSNVLLGMDRPRESLPPAGGGLRAAFDAVFCAALETSPCVVSFSGGRDSSAILALATDAARRHGLPEPVPVSMRFPGAPLTDETRWQQLVLDHLGLRGEVVELDSLEVIGPAARSVLERHGVRWPGNAYMHVPVIEAARGGTVLTGVGGDEVFATQSHRRRPRAVLLGLAPARVRGEIWLRRSEPPEFPWLTPPAHRRVARAMLVDEARWPHPWDRAMDHWVATRSFAAVDGALKLVAEGRDVTVVNPFLDRQVMAELRELGGATGFPGRTEAMRFVVGELLPEALLSRPTKASFKRPVWGEEVRAFARDWDGSGVDPADVDPERLRAEVLSPEPSFRAALLVQAAWLASVASR